MPFCCNARIAPAINEGEINHDVNSYLLNCVDITKLFEKVAYSILTQSSLNCCYEKENRKEIGIIAEDSPTNIDIFFYVFYFYFYLKDSRPSLPRCSIP